MRESVNLEIIKEPVGTLPSGQNVFIRHYLIDIHSHQFQISQYELDILFKLMKSYSDKNPEIVEE